MSTKSVGSNAVVYAMIFGLQRVVGFLMLPVYTRFLTPADYGVLQLLDMTVDVAAILFTAGFSTGVQRLYFKRTTEVDRRRVLSTAMIVEVGLAAAGAAILIIFSRQIHEVGLGGAGSAKLVRIAACNFIASTLIVVPLVLLQIEDRARTYAGVVTVKLILQVTLNVVFIVGLGLGVLGILLSTLITALLLGVLSCSWLLRRTGFAIDRVNFRELFRYGLPVQLATAGSFIIGFGDRFFLQASHGAAAVGLYGLAYQFGFLLMQLSVSPFLQAWNPQRFRIAEQLGEEERNSQYAAGFFLLNTAFLSLAAAICVFIRPTLQILTPAEFHSAFSLVPLIVFAYVFHGWTSVVGFGINFAGRTEFHAYANWTASALILVLYATLVPRFAGMGAAIATVIGLMLRFLLTLLFAQRLWPVKYSWARSLRLLGLAVTASAGGLILQTGVIWHDLAIGLGGLGAYITASWHLILGAKEREVVKSAFLSPRRLLLAVAGR